MARPEGFEPPTHCFEGSESKTHYTRKPLQDTLTAIRLGKPIASCGYDLAPNAEQHLRARLRLANLYPSATLNETIRIAQQCTFSLDELRYEYPEELVPEGETAAGYLRKEPHINLTEGILLSSAETQQTEDTIPADKWHEATGFKALGDRGFILQA